MRILSPRTLGSVALIAAACACAPLSGARVETPRPPSVASDASEAAPKSVHPADVASASRAGVVEGVLSIRPEAPSPAGAAHPATTRERPVAPADLPGLGMEGLTEENLQPLFDIPIVLNEHVLRVVRFYSQGNGRGHFGRYLNRSHRWIPMMHEILEGHGLPRDLVYVAMIESGFSMRAYSHAHAAGPWQFIPSTAEIHGLQMDLWVDERRDPVKATHAAAEYLVWLYREFQDWNLAWAGYNGGPTRVRRNMNTTGLDDYWALCEAGRLPRETCGYVPKILAAAIISKFPARFGFTPEPEPPFDYETVSLEFAADLQAIGALIGASLESLRAINPELRRQVTPPPARGESGYELRVPSGTRERFLARRGELEPSRYLTHDVYRVRPGDSFWRIARQHSTTVDALVGANPGLDPRTLRPGMEVVVPLRAGARPIVPAAREPKRAQPSGQVVRSGDGVEVRYTVRAGDSLWSIAQRHGVSTDELVSWNRLRSAGDHVHLAVGQRLVVGRGRPAQSEGARVHVLQAGETLWQLSRRYGIAVEELKLLNGIDDARALRTGQSLVVSR